MKKLSLTSKTLLALFLGAVFGIMLSHVPENWFTQTILLNGLLKLLGTGFLNAIKLIVVPLVFISIVYATASLDDLKKIGRIGGKTFFFYTLTTALAIILALLVGGLLKPGIGVDLALLQANELTTTPVATDVHFVDTLLNMIPTNIFTAFVEGNILGIIFFAILLGLSMTMVGEKAKPLIVLFESANEVLLKLVQIIMCFAPYGVFALLSTTFANFGFSALMPLIKYVVTVVIGLGLQLLVVYMGMLLFIGKLRPSLFLKKFAPIFNICLSTASSSAALPLALEHSETSFGVSKRVSSFTLPLGSTINMDGTAIMQGISVMFIAQIYGISLGFNDYIMVILSAVLASIGTAGVPGVGMVMLTMVLASVNLPLEGIALIMGVDRIIDMLRTAINVAGDNVCTILIAKSENELDEKVYNKQI
ncbi:dicarboxylate/amino acid:cation symporter [Cellulosilyticum sp. ST5]|uniref:dicarboxylate/amino acid:cation symporter n=1 Tax=Cellulosilyticum sp. ST5 TaxID=3055805 RepID=UPI003977C9F1